MNHKIYFLGNAGDIKTAGKLHSAGGIIVQTEGFQIHIDPGVGAINCARNAKLDLRDSQVLICTNNSLVSTNEVNAVINYMTLEGEDSHGVLIGALSVINGTEEKEQVITETSKKYLERVIGIKEGDKVGVGDIDVHATKIISKDQSSVGIIIESPAFKLGYLPHCNFSVTSSKVMSKVDILVINVKLPKEETENNFLNIEEAVKIVELAKPRLVVVTGLGYKLANEKTVNIIREFQKATKIQTMVAEDGMILNASTYKKAIQEKLL